jgi:hypothetical protein
VVPSHPRWQRKPGSSESPAARVARPPCALRWCVRGVLRRWMWRGPHAFELPWRSRIWCDVSKIWCVRCSSGTAARGSAWRWPLRFGVVRWASLRTSANAWSWLGDRRSCVSDLKSTGAWWIPAAWLLTVAGSLATIRGGCSCFRLDSL